MDHATTHSAAHDVIAAPMLYERPYPHLTEVRLSQCSAPHVEENHGNDAASLTPTHVHGHVAFALPHVVLSVFMRSWVTAYWSTCQWLFAIINQCRWCLCRVVAITA